MTARYLSNVVVLKLCIASLKDSQHSRWSNLDLATVGIDDKFVQDNHSRTEKNVLRGLHYQI